MRSKIRLHIFEPLVENAEIFPSTADKGAISTLVQKLKIKIIPKGENIIRTGEIASEMYFIMKGIVKVFNSEGQVIAVLGKGHNFGEMALIQENSLRNACVVADTKVSVAILTMQDFRLICDLYP
jgi:CRP-like cAMP-binding protein